MKKLTLAFMCFLFTQANAQTWNQEQKLVGTHRAMQNKFGETVSISGDYAAIGAPLESTDSDNTNTKDQAGAVYISKKQTDGSWVITQKITPSDRAEYDNFGATICLSGDFLIIGAPYHKLDANSANAVSNAGAAYIYKASGNTFTFVQKIIHSDRTTGDNFGTAVAMHGNYIVVGAIGQDFNENGGSNTPNAGAAYIFEHDGDAYVQVKKIVGLYRTGNDNFGKKVAIHGNNIIIGTRNDAKDNAGSDLKNLAGAAYIFNRGTDNTWTLKQRIVASDRAVSDYFGESVAIQDSVAIIGAAGSANGTSGQPVINAAGSAYIFKMDNSGTWNEVQKLVSNERHTDAYFGHSVAIDNGKIVIGSRYDKFDSENTNSLIAAGAAYIFDRTGANEWEYTAKITALDRKSEDALGTSVAINTENIIVGAPTQDFDSAELNNISDAGAAYVFNYACAPLTPTVITNNNTLLVSINADSYQWIDCHDNNTPIAGATNATFNPTIQGNYAATITNGACTYTTDCFPFFFMGIDELNVDNQTTIFPNPSNGKFTIASPNKAIVSVLTITGGNLKTFHVEAGTQNIELNQTPGTYLLFFITDNGSYTKRIVIK